jgi:hypothetical protein
MIKTIVDKGGAATTKDIIALRNLLVEYKCGIYGNTRIGGKDGGLIRSLLKFYSPIIVIEKLKEFYKETGGNPEYFNIPFFFHRFDQIKISTWEREMEKCEN